MEPGDEMDCDPEVYRKIFSVAERTAYRECAKKSLETIDNLMRFLLKNGMSYESFWQAAFAFGSTVCEGRSMTEVSKTLGLKSRACISKGAKQFQLSNGLPPSPYMKPEDAIPAYSHARNQQLQ